MAQTPQETSVATRYPEELAAIHNAYSATVAKEIIVNAREVIAWAKEML